ncbi:MAG: hypothetical protein RMM06_05455 [Armatimonadota bacterium]|nr:hypothetical protein [Armatimonadota bacterium]
MTVENLQPSSELTSSQAKACTTNGEEVRRARFGVLFPRRGVGMAAGLLSLRRRLRA